MSDIENADSPPCLPRSGRKADDPRMIGGWKIGRTIGKGSSGRVKIARHSKTGQYAAIKIVSKVSLVNSRMSLHELGDEADRILLSIEREIVIMKLIDHPNIMRLYDVWETSNELYLILEYVEGGELFDYLCDKGRLEEEEALDYFQQIINAIDYCHRFNIAHRDLKPENLLLDSNKKIKVADFGMAAWQGGVGAGKELLETACGSPHYAAPEVIMGKPYNGSMSDIWSCGVVLFALFAGRLPFDDENIHVLLDKVKLAVFTMPPDIPSGAQDLIKRMLEKDLEKRITMQEILVHPWFISRPPKDGLYPPPSLEEIARPVTDASEIDSDIFGNLRTLWHGAPDEDILEGLTNSERTWEKGIYHLLVKYRTRHMENYGAREDDKPRQRKRSTRKRKETMARPLPADVKPLSQMSDLEQSPQVRPSRPEPPTPTRARSRGEDSVSNPSDDRPAALSKKSERKPVPLIHVEDPTSLLSPLSSHPSESLRSPISPLSPVWDALDIPPIQVPELQDENVQHFFQQIVEHLNVMQNRTGSSVASGSANVTPNPDLVPSELATTQGLKTRKFWGNNATMVPPPTPATVNLTSRESDEFLLVERSPNGLITRPDQGIKGSSALGLGFEKLGDRRQPTSSRPVPRRPFQRKTKSDDGPTGTENGMLRGDHTVVKKKSSLRSNDDNTRRVALADKRVQIMLPVVDDFLKSTANNKMTLDPLSPALSDGSEFLPSSVPRRSWFGNLFKFKPVTYHLLSVHDASTTREECRRLLAGAGVRTILIESEGNGVLKCRLDEIRDPAGIMAVAKAVQFRVEVHPVTEVERLAGYKLSLAMVLEKGALSSFKLVHSRVRREWDMDNTSMAYLLPSPELTMGGRFAEEIGYPHKG